MKTTFKTFILILCYSSLQAQIDIQKRFQSDTRKYYVWNIDYDKYVLEETEYEHSIIDIREIGSKTNGYVVISMNDNGKNRLHHGSIYNYSKDTDNEGSWSIKSKFTTAKLTYSPKENTMTYLYDASNDRYKRLIIFSVEPDEITNSGMKSKNPKD